MAPQDSTADKTTKKKSLKFNLKGWAKGAREDLVLRPNLNRYIDACQRGWLVERNCLSSICTQFHVQIPLDLADDEEPEIPLAAFDPSKAYDFGAGLSDADKEKRLTRIEMLNKVSDHELVRQLMTHHISSASAVG